MSVGTKVGNDLVDQQLTNLSVAMRNLMQQVSDLSKWVNGQGDGLAMLEALGYDAADAQAAQNMISYLNTMAGVYFGTATQGTAFNFDNELSQLWAGR